MNRFLRLPEDPSPSERRLQALLILLAVTSAGRGPKLLPLKLPEKTYTMTTSDLEDLTKIAYCRGGEIVLTLLDQAFTPEEIRAQLARMHATVKV